MMSGLPVAGGADAVDRSSGATTLYPWAQPGERRRCDVGVEGRLSEHAVRSFVRMSVVLALWVLLARGF